MADRVGQQFGNYRLVALMGQGGYAEVYLGQHVRLELQAAIKVLHTHLTDQEAEHFQQEAQTIAKLTHSSIVRILDYDVQEGVPFLVMDYAPGGSLRRRHPKGSALPLPQIVSYVKQVAAALQYAHEQKFIHRDVKPENMLVGRQQEVLLSDFGLAALAHSSGSLSTQAAVGTLPYMAPEQIEGHPRAASDQYALGVVVYEWLCGVCPFEGSLTEVMVQHLTMPPPPLHEKVATIPLSIEQVVLRALAKDPKARFTSVHDFATALQGAAQTSISAPALSPLLPASTAEPANPYQTVPMADVQKPSSSAPVSAPPSTPSIGLGREEPVDMAQQALQPEPMGKVPANVTPLVGRQREWAQLQTVWQSASTGYPHLLVLSGEAGIGKTRLAEELFSWVAQQDLSTARAACYAVEGELAYAPVGFWLRAEAIRSGLSSLPALWLSEVARFVPQILVEHPGLPPPGPLTERWQRQASLKPWPVRFWRRASPYCCSWTICSGVTTRRSNGCTTSCASIPPPACSSWARSVPKN
jgi:serine/threonine protein kinase